MHEITLLSPFLQWGFAGTTLLLIVALWWSLREFVGIVKRAIEVIPQVSQDVSQLRDEIKDTGETVDDLRDRILQFRCPFRDQPA